MVPDRMDVHPNLMIPGVQKGATTTLFEAFGKHPRCLTSRWKEPDVFAYTPKLNGENPYQEYFRPPDNRTLDSYDYIIESSTSYFFVEESPKRLAEHLPDSTKFIVLLRDPVNRAVSAYWHLVKRREESRPLDEVFTDLGESAEEILSTENENIEKALNQDRIDAENFRNRYDDPTFPFRYAHNSCYSVHVDRFLASIDRSRVLFLLTERLQQKPEFVANRITEFLDWEDKLDVEHLRSRRNKTIVPRQYQFLEDVKNAVKSLLPKMLKEASIVRSFYETFFYTEKPEPGTEVLDRLRRSLGGEYRRIKNRLDLPVQAYWEHV